MPYGDGRWFLRGRIWWIAYSVRGREVRESVGPKLADAKARLRERRAELTLGRYVRPKDEQRLVRELLDQMLTEAETRGVRSIRSMRYHVAPIRRALGDVPAVYLTARDVERYQRARLRKGRAPATVNREVETLTRALRLAEERGELRRAPKLPRLRVDNTRQGFLERGELERICRHLPWHLAEAARFARVTGWRKGEVLPLRWDAVEDAHVRLWTSKTGRPRVVPVSGELREILARCRAHRAYQNSGRAFESEFVFHRYGRAVKDHTKPWQAACAAAGLAGKLFHDLRRTAARNMVLAGVPTTTAMRVTGHVTDAMFRRYAIVETGDMADALDRLQDHETRTKSVQRQRGTGKK